MSRQPRAEQAIISPAAGDGQPDPETAYARWLDSLARAGWTAGQAIEPVPVTDALGRVSAERILARWPSPRSDCAAMDGIAVSAAVVAGRTDTLGARGDRGEVRLPAGTFAWIDTGDPIPDGADTVVVRERLLPQADGSIVIAGRDIAGSDSAGSDSAGRVVAGRDIAGRVGGSRRKNVRRAGEDFAAGEALVPAGRRLRPGDLAAAAAGGYGSVAVTRQLVVAIIPTGDEIRAAGAVPRWGEIIDSNSPMLAGRCRELGAVPVVSDVQPDDPDVLAAEIGRAALGADLVLVIAGSSHGRDDHASAVLAQVGGVAVTGVAVRPGHPALLGHAKRAQADGPAPAAGPGIVPVIGLPGYPLAAAVIFELFAVPMLALAGGAAGPAGPALLATLDRDWASPPGVEDWVLVTLAAVPRKLAVATPARRGAGSVSQLARADAWWRIPAGHTEFAADATIEIMPLASA